MSASPSPWRDSIHTQITRRNERQSKNYVDIIANYTALLNVVTTLHSERDASEKEASRLKQDNELLNKKLDNLREETQGAAVTSDRIKELEATVAEKQEEINRLYKEKADLASTSLDVKQQMEAEQARMAEKDSEVSDLKRQLEEAEANCQATMQTIEERAEMEKLLQEEHGALQKEFQDRDDRLRALTAEHEQLVERWLAKSKADADRLNENNNAFYEKKQEEVTAEISRIASTEVTGVVPEHFAMGHAVGGIPRQASRTIVAHDSEINTVAFSLNGQVYATGSGDKVVKIWDFASNRVQHKLRGSAQSVMCVAFTDDGERVVGSSNDNTARIWGLKTGRLLHNLTGHTEKIYAAQFTHDSHHLLSGSHDRSVKLWDAERGYCLRTILCYSSVNDLTLSRDGYAVYSAHVDGRLRVWDTKTGDVVHEVGNMHTQQITSVTMTSDFNYVLTNSRDGTLKLIDVRTLDSVSTLSAPTYKNAFNWNKACLSPDNKYAAAGGQDGSVFIWDVQNGTLERTLKAHQAAVAAVAWNPVARAMVSVDKDRNLVVWE